MRNGNSDEASAIDRIADPWGPRTPYARQDGHDEPSWPPRTDPFLSPGVAESDVERWVQSASVLHSNGDALDIGVRGGQIVGVRGRANDRVNRGRLGPKDLFGWQADASSDRPPDPRAGGGGGAGDPAAGGG